MIDQAIVAFAGLGFFLAGLHLLSEAVRALAARHVRRALARLSRVPFSSALTGTLLGAVTQSTSAAAYVCIGLLNAKAISFPAALAISSWSGVGTSLLVFMASLDLRLAALLSLSLVALFYLASLHRNDAGRRATELLLAIGITLLGLAMVKEAGHLLEHDDWIREFFTFSSESWIYGFLIGLIVTLVMQSSSTVSILVVALSATGLLPLRDAIVLVCGANLGSGLSVALISSHLTGLPRQLAIWQAVVKGTGSAIILLVTLLIFATGFANRFAGSLPPVPTVIAVTYLMLNLLGAVIAGIFQRPFMAFADRIAPRDVEKQQFEPEYIIDEAAEDPETAVLLARREQSRLIGLLPQALAPLRDDEAGTATRLENGERKELSLGLAGDIANFISEAVDRHPQNGDVSVLLLLQRCNDHLMSLIDGIHSFVEELGAMKDQAPHERAMSQSMTETLHLLLSLATDQANGNADEAEMIQHLTRSRSEVMTRFRNEIVSQQTQSNANREALFVATGLFERMIWLVRQISADVSGIEKTYAAR